MKGLGLYILDENNNPVLCEDVLVWGRWMARAHESRQRIVAQMRFRNGTFLSTVFLGIDHSWGDGPPVLYETMIFGGEHDEIQKRYCTWEEAFEGHQNAVKYFTEQMLYEADGDQEGQETGQ